MCAAEVLGPPGRHQVSVESERVVWQPPSSDGGDASQNYQLESSVSGVGGKLAPVNVGFNSCSPSSSSRRRALAKSTRSA